MKIMYLGDQHNEKLPASGDSADYFCAAQTVSIELISRFEREQRLLQGRLSFENHIAPNTENEEIAAGALLTVSTQLRIARERFDEQL